MIRRLFSGVIAIVLLTLASAAYSAPPRQANVHKFGEAGLQFTVPAGWEVEAEDGAVKIHPKTGGEALIAFVALPVPADMTAEQKTGLFDTLVEKSSIANAKLGDYKDNQTLGGIHFAAQAFEGKNNGHEVEGVYYLFSAEKLVFVVLAADKSASEALANDAISIMKSIKKSE